MENQKIANILHNATTQKQKQKTGLKKGMLHVELIMYIVKLTSKLKY